ncbi:MAG: DUF116 domain-containing protein [Elusimicrobia bacterium]|nr:DUF116 domain-containing protein [Elusimicrobiota bacterium]
MSKFALLTKTYFFLFFALGTWGFKYFNGFIGIIFSILIILAGLSGLIISFGLGKYLPIPFILKKGLLFNIALPIVGLFGRDEAVMYLVELNHSINPKKSGRLMLLLPTCMQFSGCKENLEEDISNCRKCGRCQIGWVLENSPEDMSIIYVKGGRAAIENVKKINPSVLIAIACEKELEEGIRKILPRPVWAVRNLKPEGPCRNTVVLPNEYLDTLEKALRQ